METQTKHLKNCKLSVIIKMGGNSLHFKAHAVWSREHGFADEGADQATLYKKYMWATRMWNMFDFGADARAEGTVLNRFDIDAPKQRFSLNNKISDIMESSPGKLLFLGVGLKVKKKMDAVGKEQTGEKKSATSLR